MFTYHIKDMAYSYGIWRIFFFSDDIKRLEISCFHSLAYAFLMFLPRFHSEKAYLAAAFALQPPRKNNKKISVANFN